MVASIQDKVGSWYSNLETGAVGSTITGGGVGKYLKAWTASSVDVTGSAGATDDSSEKRKVIASTHTFKKSFIVLWFLSKRKSPAGWWSAPALNPKMRRGLSVLLVVRFGNEHTRTCKSLEWFGPPEHNTLLHYALYCL
jgi:hypothetical protein